MTANTKSCCPGFSLVGCFSSSVLLSPRQDKRWHRRRWRRRQETKTAEKSLQSQPATDNFLFRSSSSFGASAFMKTEPPSTLTAADFDSFLRSVGPFQSVAQQFFRRREFFVAKKDHYELFEKSYLKSLFLCISVSSWVVVGHTRIGSRSRRTAA